MTLLAIDWANVGIKAFQLILSLSLIVIVHEFGHYLPSKLFKCRVEKFFLFFDHRSSASFAFSAVNLFSLNSSRMPRPCSACPPVSADHNPRIPRFCLPQTGRSARSPCRCPFHSSEGANGRQPYCRHPGRA